MRSSNRRGEPVEHEKDYLDVAAIVRRLDQAVAAKDVTALDVILEPVWHGKCADAEGKPS
jgi:hypothetical protein